MNRIQLENCPCTVNMFYHFHKYSLQVYNVLVVELEQVDILLIPDTQYPDMINLLIAIVDPVPIDINLIRLFCIASDDNQQIEIYVTHLTCSSNTTCMQIYNSM